VATDDDFIQYFWETLENFDDSQRSQFLRFVWARTRLPASKEEFTQKFKIQSASSAGAIANPDKYVTFELIGVVLEQHCSLLLTFCAGIFRKHTRAFSVCPCQNTVPKPY